jgi:hypothetical protein
MDKPKKHRQQPFKIDLSFDEAIQKIVKVKPLAKNKKPKKK